MLLDKSQTPWVVGVGLAAVVATAAFFLIPAPIDGAQGGSTVIGLTFGIIAYLIMLFCAALGLKRRVPHWRLGKAQNWLRGHIWLGLLIAILVPLHAAFRVKDMGPMTVVLWVTLIVVVVSGIFGVLIQQTIPRILWATLRSPRARSRDPLWKPSMNPESPAQQNKEMMVDCANRARLIAGRFSGKFDTQGDAKADRMKCDDPARFTFDEVCPPMPVVTAAPAAAPAAPKPAAPAAPAPAPAAAPVAAAPVAAAGGSTAVATAPPPAPPKPAAPAVPAVVIKAPMGAEPIRQFFATTGQPFFEGIGGAALLNETNAASVFEALRTATPPYLHPCVDDLEELADRRRVLIRQRRWVAALHGWLIVHVPLSWGFIVLVAFHAWYSLRYSGGVK